MQIYPAIDIKDGCCVRLVQGDFEQVTVYNDDPVSVAKEWEKKGAAFLHLVDLDGALHGAAYSDEVVKRIVAAVSIPVQIGGGIRTMGDIRAKLEMGVNRVILGTVAVRDPALTRSALDLYKERIVVGVDASNGKVAISGWKEISEHDSLAMIKDLADAGVQTVVYTDVSKDGMMSGPNVPMYKEAATTPTNIIAAGGVSTLDDLRALKESGIDGAIIGKALYLGSIDLQEAIEVAQR
jgi:phosphoribosylformimino-5-aminoimidazole carboxamide ribotide isomerase